MERILLFSFIYTNILVCFVRSVPSGYPSPLPCRELPTANTGTKLDCVVEKGQYLNYRDIRDLTGARQPNEKFNISITCNGGKVFLPWPFKAKNVIGLKVQGCRVEGFLSERSSRLVIPDELKTVYLIDNVLEVTVRQLYDSLTNLDKLSQGFECGSTNIQVSVFRNIKYEFPMENIDMTTMILMEKLLSGDTLQAVVSHNTLCAYPHLKYLEESGTNSLSSVHFKLVEENKYPQLTHYSTRNNSLGRIPSELKNIPVAYLPSLENLDMSHNNIGSLDFVFSAASASRRAIYIDMRYNNIRDISPSFVYQMTQSSVAVIDLRNNPIRCSCPLYLYGLYLDQLSQTDPELNSLRDIQCFMPSGNIVVERRILEPGFGRSLCIGRI